MNDVKNVSNKKIFLKRFLISLLCIFLGIFIFLFIYNYGYLFEKEERGHLASIFFNLNKFEIDISEENKNSCEISWNKTLIYKNGQFINKNINLERYVYGDNYFKVSINNNSKYYCLFKPNNWEYHNFKFSINNEKINFWIDEKIQEENTYISKYYNSGN